MNWRLTFLVLLGSVVWAEQCQITSPLPVPVLLSGCTYSGSLPSNSTSYIQNTLSPTTTTQVFSVQNSSTSGAEYLPYITGTQCLEEVNGQTVGTGSACSASSNNQVSLSTGVTGSLYAGNVNGLITSTTTLQSNINAVGTATGTIQTQLTSVAAATGTIQSQANLIGTATGQIETQILTIGTATGTIQTQLTNIATATGTIQTQLTSVASATGTLASSVASSTASLQGQVNDLVSPSTGVLAGAFPNTVIISSIAAQIQHNIAGLYLSTITVSASHTITSTDTVVFASAPVSSIIAATQYVYTLPYSSNAFNNGSGQVIQITKVDASTGPVKIQTQGGNLIDGTTGLLTLNAIGQTDELVADGNSGWWPHGSGLQITPSLLGLAQEGGSSAIMSASSDTVVCPFFVNVPVAVTGFRTFSITCTGASKGFSNFAVYDQLGNLLVSSSSVVCPGAAVMQVTLTTPVNLPPGQYYYGMQIDNATTSVGGQGPNAGNGATTCSRQTSTTGTLPNPFTFGTTDLKTPAVFVQVAGGKTGI